MVRHLAGRYPLLLALVAQLGACLGVAVLLYLGAQLSAWRPSALAAELLQGLLAAGLARGLGLSRWWGWLNLGFVLVLLNWNSIGERVPLYLTGAQTRKELMALLAQQAPDFRFVDLGCGPAGSLLSLARQFPRAQFVGVETAPLSFVIAWLRALPRSNCRIRYENLWRTDLAQFDVVYCFLSPAPMARLWAKAQAQMPAGSHLVSNTFEVPGVPADRQVELHDWRNSRLLLWQMPGC